MWALRVLSHMSSHTTTGGDGSVIIIRPYIHTQIRLIYTHGLDFEPINTMRISDNLLARHLLAI